MLVTYLACLIVVTPYAARSCNNCASGLAEAHADVVLKYLKLVTRSTQRISSVSLWSGSQTVVLLQERRLQRKLVEW